MKTKISHWVASEWLLLGALSATGLGDQTGSG